MLLAIDYGGTRCKMARFSGKERIGKAEVIASPENHQDLLLEISQRWHKGDKIALALQGGTPIPMVEDSLWQYGPLPRKEENSLTRLELESLFKNLQLPSPQIIIGDVAAAGFALAPERGRSLVVQLSTGIGAYCFSNGSVILRGGKSLISSTDREYSFQGESRSYYHWLRREFRQAWLDVFLSEKDWHEIAETTHPHRQLLADIFVDFVSYSYDIYSAERVFIIGGGAVAMEKFILPPLREKGLPAEIITDTETTGLRGLAHLSVLKSLKEI